MTTNMTLGDLVVSAFEWAGSSSRNESEAARRAAEGIVGALLESGSPSLVSMLDIRVERAPEGRSERRVSVRAPAHV